MKSKLTYRIGCGIFLFAAAISSGCYIAPNDEAMSQPALEKIEALDGEVQKLRVSDYEEPIESDKRFTVAIENLQKLSSAGERALAEIYDLSMRKNSEEKIKGWQKGMADLMTRRYNAYQLWATEKCKNAWVELDATTNVDLPTVGAAAGAGMLLGPVGAAAGAGIVWLISGTTEEEAYGIFTKNLVAIDPALLSPEINSMYQKIYQPLFDKLEEDKQAELAHYVINNPKKTLEDF